MSQPPLKALRAFEAVARTGSFNAAAKALFVTQSAVSHQVRHLEEWLGNPLFDRRGGRPRLLPHGEELARGLSLALGEIEAACDSARATIGSEPLVIAAIPSVAVCWLIPRLSVFRAQPSNIPIHIVYAIHGQVIDFRHVHLAFTYSQAPPDQAGVHSELFLPGVSAPVCSPTLLGQLSGGRPDAKEILTAGLLHDTDTSGWWEWLDRVGEGMPATLSGPVFEDFNLLRTAALSGQGVALCPLAMIREDLVQGHLVRVSDVTVLEKFNYYLLSVTSTTAERQSSIDAFRNWAFAAREQ